MSNNLLVIVKKNGKEIKKFKGRFVGFIDDAEMRAIINTPDAGRKIFSAETCDFYLINGASTREKRLVIATTSYSEGMVKEVFITPRINFMHFGNAERTIVCDREKSFVLSALQGIG